MAKEEIKSNGWQPTAKQMQVIIMLLDVSETKTKTEIAKVAGISTKTLWAWLKDSDFLDYMNSQISTIIKSASVPIWHSLIKKAKTGDVSGIKLFFEMTGDYKDRKELTGANGQPITFMWASEDDNSDTI